MAPLTLVDLDQRPDLLPRLVPLFAAHQPGREHIVCGLPPRMGLPPTVDDLRRCLGVLIALDRAKPVGALAICPYSDEQVTLWGPVVDPAADYSVVGTQLVAEARRALKAGNFESVRALAELRNRKLREFMLAHGLAAWKDNHVYERALDDKPPAAAGVRLVLRRDHGPVGEVLTQAFPDSLHCLPDLTTRESEGYRHYLCEDAGAVVAAAAVQDSGRRSWLKLIAVRQGLRGKKVGDRLLSGILHGEAALGFNRIGMEILADNRTAIALVESKGCVRKWTATVMTGPV